MGKHENGYERVERDYYPTPPWVADALAEHVDLAGKTIWECAAGGGQMVEALRAAGAAKVWASDVASYGYLLDAVLDFVTGPTPDLHFDLICTNPPWGLQGRLAVAFVEAGLRHIASGRARAFALLLSADFDSATLRPRLFRDCNYFVGKVVLTRRIVWFKRTDGKREQPKENAAWYLWEQPLLRTRQPPVVLYAPSGNAVLGPLRAEAKRRFELTEGLRDK
jgi:hypothetical protein